MTSVVDLERRLLDGLPVVARQSSRSLAIGRELYGTEPAAGLILQGT
jgi:hypothetical protein